MQLDVITYNVMQLRVITYNVMQLRVISCNVRQLRVITILTHITMYSHAEKSHNDYKHIMHDN